MANDKRERGRPVKGKGGKKNHQVWVSEKAYNAIKLAAFQRGVPYGAVVEELIKHLPAPTLESKTG